MTNSENMPDLTPVAPPEDYACRIKNHHQYLGYIAWSEVYESLGKHQEVEEILLDLVEIFPKHPHAFLKLWDLKYKAGEYYECLDYIEELFIKMGDFYTIPEIRIAFVPLLYAKSLFKIKQYVFTLELLQNEFCKRPLYTIFLYFFGKYAVK